MADAPPNWTYDRLLALAPDTQTIEQARRLFFARRWRILEGNGHWLWGEYETAHGQVARAAVRLEPPLLRCSCQSPRKPCKHALALIMLFLNRPEAWVVRMEAPDWATKPTRPTPKPAPASDQEDRAKQAERLALMDQGVEELHQWLRDLLRGGLAQLSPQDESWELVAKRMVDSKMGGIARRIRLLPLLMDKDDWPERLLGELGLLYLFVQVWRRKATLTTDQKWELLQIAGWNLRKEKVLARDGLADNWLVLGKQTGSEEQLTYRRTWLRGEQSGKMGLVLDFAYGRQGFEEHYVIGSVLKGELVYYPGVYPQRALLRGHQPSRAAYEAEPGYTDFAAAGQAYAEALALHPWLLSFPMLLEAVRPVFDQARQPTAFLLDGEQRILPLAAPEQIWAMLALSGGEPITIFGEYDGETFRALSVITEGRVLAL